MVLKDKEKVAPREQGKDAHMEGAAGASASKWDPALNSGKERERRCRIDEKGPGQPRRHTLHLEQGLCPESCSCPPAPQVLWEEGKDWAYLVAV